MRLALEIASEAIRAQHLQGTEEDESRDVSFLNRQGDISPCCGYAAQLVFVFCDEFSAQRGGEVRFGLPKEGDEVVEQGTSSAALEIDEVGIAIAHHDVAGLEIAVHEAGAGEGEQGVSQLAELCFQQGLGEVLLRGFQVAVLEVV